jgi:cysteinyl-tRNA synthetase
MKGYETLNKLKPSGESTFDVAELKNKCYESMDDDLNSPVLLSYLFEAVRFINSAADGSEKIDEQGIASLKELFGTFVFEILGLKNESESSGDEKLVNGLMEVIKTIRQDARNNKDWATSDKIRNELNRIGIILKDTKGGVEWERE